MPERAKSEKETVFSLPTFLSAKEAEPEVNDRSSPVITPSIEAEDVTGVAPVLPS